jgi:hypothetical protein
MKIETIVMTVGIAVAATLIADYLTRPKNPALATCKGSTLAPGTSTPLLRSFACARMFGTKAATEAEFQQCPLGPTCQIGGVCACTFCRVKANGVQNTGKSQSGSIQTWSKNPYGCGRSACYATAVKSATSCVTQVVATQGAQGNCGWGKCGDFASCC